ncbi:MAG: TIGR02757 family protein [Crocinitomicaceae bacterium]|nr:TIGR02757 family protein [Crocinitomicaceae bacterium]MCF8433772.1 TIGR02757 family protein [Crocinitomicaceae bacterium]
MTKLELKEFLDYKAEQYEKPVFLESDPIQIPHRFSRKEDIEISGFLMATIAWGNRVSILKSGEKLLEIMEHSPFDFIKNYKQSPDMLHPFVHRTFNAGDLDFFFRSLHEIYKSGNLEACFVDPQNSGNVKNRIIHFRNIFLTTDHEIRSAKHLSDPARNSAAKRLNMYLRWMIRPNTKGVDFGIWKTIKPSELNIPLDVHTSKYARQLGLLTRKQDDWKALDELMVNLREFDPEDPVKYDFALFGLGAFEKF